MHDSLIATDTAMVNQPSAHRMGELMLATFEHRRDQMVQRSSILLAASSGLLVVILQFILRATPPPRDQVTIGLTLLAIVIASLSLLQSLDIIRRLRKSHQPRTRHHLLFFETSTSLTPQQLRDRLMHVSESDYLDEIATQCVSLARNLRDRYDALRRAYRSFSIAFVLFLLALGASEVQLMSRSALP